MSHSRRILSVCLCFLALAGLGAERRLAAQAGEKATVTAKNGVPEIPFKLINNHLILPVSINGSAPLDVALDTGMPAAGLAIYGGSSTDELDLDINPTIEAQVGGAGGTGRRMMAKIAMNESIALAGLEIEGTRVIIMPEMSDFSGYHDGIIGYTLFSRFVVEIDYDEMLLRLHDPASYEAAAGAHVVPITFEGNLPYVMTRLVSYGREPVDTKVVVDLGASHAISLNTDHSEDIVLPEETLSAVIGRGLSGPVRGEVGRIAELGLGDARLRDVVATFPVSEHQNLRGVDSLGGNLGSDVLRRFNTTFDYSGERLVLVPNRSFEEPFRFDHSGLRLAPGEDLTVEGVIAGSPAEEAGIRVGDVVTHLGGRAVSAEDYGEIQSTLRGRGEVRLTLRRGEEMLEKVVVLRRLI